MSAGDESLTPVVLIIVACLTRMESLAMKMSHLANFVLMIVGGAAQEVAHAVKRRFSNEPREK